MRRMCAVVLVGASLVVPTAVATGQEPPNVLIDDPLGALGDDRPVVEQRLTTLAGDGLAVVSVVPSLNGRSVEVVVAERFAVLAPTGSPVDLLFLLVVDQAGATVAVRDRAAIVAELGEAVATEAFGLLDAASMVATETFASGDAGAAALAGIAALESATTGTEDPPAGDSGVEGVGWVPWLVAALVVLGLVGLVRVVKPARWLRRLSPGRRSAGPPPVRWRGPGRAPSAVPALTAGISGAVLPVVLPAALAWWLGRATRREIADSGGQLGGGGFAIAAFVLSVYSLVATISVAVSAFS